VNKVRVKKTLFEDQIKNLQVGCIRITMFETIWYIYQYPNPTQILDLHVIKQHDLKEDVIIKVH